MPPGYSSSGRPLADFFLLDLCFCLAGLFSPSLNVHTHDQEPQAERQFRDEAEDHDRVGELEGKGWDEIGQPTCTGGGHEHAENARQEGRLKDEIADQQSEQTEEPQLADW